MAISLGLATGSQFSLVILVPITLGFLLYLAPERRSAAITIWAAACAGGGVLLLAGYFFHPQILWQSLRAAKLLDLSAGAFSIGASYGTGVSRIIHASPLLLILSPVALLAYTFWRRARYFGNTAPLLMVGVCVVLALAAPGFPGQGFWLIVLPFLFVSVAGVFADLLETRLATPLRIILTALLSGYALWSLVALAQV